TSLRLLKRPPPVRDLVERQALSMGQARALLALDDARAIERAARRVVARQMSVRQVEALVRALRGNRQPTTPSRPASGSAAVRDLETRLSQKLGTRARVHDQGGHGTIEITWSSLDELDRLLDVLLAGR